MDNTTIIRKPRHDLKIIGEIAHCFSRNSKYKQFRRKKIVFTFQDTYQEPYEQQAFTFRKQLSILIHAEWQDLDDVEKKIKLFDLKKRTPTNLPILTFQ